MKSRHFGLRLTEQQHERLEELAQAAGVDSPSEVVRMLIDHAEVRRVVVPCGTFEIEEFDDGRVTA